MYDSIECYTYNIVYYNAPVNVIAKSPPPNPRANPIIRNTALQYPTVQYPSST